MRRIAQAVLPIALLLSATQLAANETIFLEENGLVVMDVESVTAAPGWAVKTEIAGYKGSSYFEWEGPDYFHPASAGNGTVTYHFRITTPGNYEMRWRNRIAVGDNATEHNDSWLRFPTGTNIPDQHPLSGWTKGFMNGLNAWTWSVATVDHVNEPIRQYFDAGDHTFEISGRSAGHAIDRIVLFQYETIAFGHGKFEGYTESSKINADPNPNPVPEPEPEPEPEPTPEPEPEPEPETPRDDWSFSESGQEANTCIGNELSLAASANTQVNGTTIVTGEELKIDGAGQQSLLKFDLSLLPGTTESAALRFNIGADSGDGSILLSTGSHSDWQESDDTLSAGPDPSVSLGEFDGIWTTQKHYALPFDHTLLSRSDETVIMAMSAGSNDLSILSRTNAKDPRLVFTGSTGFCAEYEQLLEEKLLNETPMEPEPIQEPEVVVVPEPESTQEPQTTTQTDTTNSTDTKKSKLGSADYLLLLALALSMLLLRRNLVTGYATVAATISRKN